MSGCEPQHVTELGTAIYALRDAYWRYLVLPAGPRLAAGEQGQPALQCVRYDAEAGGRTTIRVGVSLTPTVEEAAAIDAHLQARVRAAYEASAGDAAPAPPTHGRRWHVVQPARGTDPTAPVPGGGPPEVVLDGHAWWRGMARLVLDDIGEGPYEVAIDGADPRATVELTVPDPQGRALWAALSGEGPALSGTLELELTLEATRQPFVGAPSSVTVSAPLASLVAAAAPETVVLTRYSLDDDAQAGLQQQVSVAPWPEGLQAVEIELLSESGALERHTLTSSGPVWVRTGASRVVRGRAQLRYDGSLAGPPAWGDWRALDGEPWLVEAPSPREVTVQLNAEALDFDGVVVRASISGRLEDGTGRRVRALDPRTIAPDMTVAPWTFPLVGTGVMLAFRVEYVLTDGRLISAPARGVTWQQPLDDGAVLLEVPAPPVRRVEVPVSLAEGAEPLQVIVSLEHGTPGGAEETRGSVRLTTASPEASWGYLCGVGAADTGYRYRVMAVLRDGTDYHASGQGVGPLQIALPGA